MKKLFALLLILAMLVPLGLVPVANAEEVTVQPFYSLGWSDFNNLKYPYLEGLTTSSFSNIGGNAYISYGGAKVTYNKEGIADADVEKFAQAMKKTMDRLPQGLRYWHLFGPAKILKLKPVNVIYLDYGVDQMKALMEVILKKYKEIGGQLDGLVVDTEYTAMGNWYIYSNNVKEDPMVYKKIVEDPRYATEVRPLLEERGFLFYDNVTDYTPEIYSISRDSGSKYDQSRNIWDTVMRIRLNRYVDEWCYAPLKENFPEASLSDYQSTDSLAWLKLVAVTDDGQTLGGGNSIKAGTASCYSFYYSRPSTDFFKNMQKYASYNDALYAATAFNTFLYDTNFAKHMYLSNDNRQIAPWITSYVYNDEKAGTLANTPYYSELIFHLGMLDPEPFLSYTYTPEYSGEEWDMTCVIQNELMAELTRVAGFSDRKPIEMSQYWNSDFVVSGMYANGRNIWRISPNTDVISVEDFKVAGADPTFSVSGQTITFPGGKIIEDAAITHVGTCGYWVETSKDVTPITTNLADRYTRYPSLVVDFEAAAEGAFDFNTCNPAGAWEFTWKKNSATTIETVNGNKVLVFTGTSEARSKTLPGNITAGDTYAEDQAWQITVTVPEGLAADAEIILLNYVGTSQKAKDGGFKIAGGKLYYGTLGTDAEGQATQEYKELCDIAPGTYIFRRDVNFNNAEKYLSTFTVYDATGNEVKSAKDVVTPAFKAITTINLATKNADKGVQMDNFVITLTGTATDFEIYNAKTGILLTDDAKEAPRDAATAYRLSWLNATAQEETATVMAAIYNGTTLVEEKVIKEVKMAPGYDGVETGVVDVAEGQSVKVYLKTTIKKAEDPSTQPTEPTNPTNPTDPTEPTTGDKDDKGGLSIGLIAVIVAAVVAVAGVVVVLVVTKKPKTKK